MWLLVLALSYGSATLGPQVYATESACISAGDSKTYMGRQVKFVRGWKDNGRRDESQDFT